MTLPCNTVSFTPGMLNWWPPKLPDAVLDYALNITPSIDPTTDFAVNCTVAIAPSGAGEMTASNLTITTKTQCDAVNTILTVTMTGGVPGRNYLIKFDVIMSDGRVFEFLVNQDVPIILPGVTPSVPPSTDFGTPLMNLGGAGNPVIAFSGTPTSPLEFVIMPNLGVSLDGVLSFLGPTIDYVGPSAQNGLTTLEIGNAAGYLDSANGFAMTSTGMTTLAFPNLVSWVGAFTPNMAALTTLNFADLAYVNGAFTPTLNALTTLALPSLRSFGGNFAPTMSLLQSFTMNSFLRVFNGNFSLIGASLNQPSVDGILISLAALNGTGSTTLYTGRTVDLSGGSSLAPSSAGLAAKAILVAASNTVTTN